MFGITTGRRALALIVGITSLASVGTAGTAAAEPRPIHNIQQHADREFLLDACPVDGPSTFEDSWGWRRSGGRSHEGVDLIADRGTPVVAVRDGRAQFKSNRLGGKAVWLTTENGDRFYYAHLDGFSGASRQVEAGELIGWVGSTGNARGPHLHFETLPDGQTENPFPHTHQMCVALPEALAEAERRATAIPAGAISDPDVWARFIPDQS